MREFFFIFALLISAPAFAQNALEIDLAENRVDITTGFDGAEIILYGVTRRDGDVAVVIRGPERTMVVRRKDKILGAWMNMESLEFRRVPAFYDYALSGPEFKEAGIDALDFYPEDNEEPEVIARFKEALVRNKQSQGLFPLKPAQIEYVGDNFFKVRFVLPSYVATGIYSVTAYLSREGRPPEVRSTEFRVGQVGTSARIYSFAQDYGLAYGLLSVALAFMTGAGAYFFMRRD